MTSPAEAVPQHIDAEEERTERVTMRCPTCRRTFCGRVVAAPAKPCDEPMTEQDWADPRIT